MDLAISLNSGFSQLKGRIQLRPMNCSNMRSISSNGFIDRDALGSASSPFRVLTSTSCLACFFAIFFLLSIKIPHFLVFTMEV